MHMLSVINLYHTNAAADCRTLLGHPVQAGLLLQQTARPPRAGRSAAAADCRTLLGRPVQTDLLLQQTAGYC